MKSNDIFENSKYVHREGLTRRLMGGDIRFISRIRGIFRIVLNRYQEIIKGENPLLPIYE